jgi:signal transduction histidine kinase
MGISISAGLLASMLRRPARAAPRRTDRQETAGELQSEIAMLKRDIDRLERSFRDAERQLLQAQKMEAVGELTGGIAHDFNNILTVITAMIKVLADGVADKPDLAAIAKMINDAAGRGCDLTQRLLSFSRMQPLQPRATDLNLLMAETTKLFKPALGDHIRVETSFANGLGSVMIDPTLFANALLNLALNARDAMPEGGVLALTTRNVDIDHSAASGRVAPGRYAVLEVRDNGMGIPLAIRHRIFEPFFTTKEEGRGSGLGLSMVCRFIKQSGGEITIDSVEGSGTTVRMYLPHAAEAAVFGRDQAADTDAVSHWGEGAVGPLCGTPETRL